MFLTRTQRSNWILFYASFFLLIHRIHITFLFSINPHPFSFVSLDTHIISRWQCPKMGSKRVLRCPQQNIKGCINFLLNFLPQYDYFFIDCFLLVEHKKVEYRLVGKQKKLQLYYLLYLLYLLIRSEGYYNLNLPQACQHIMITIQNPILFQLFVPKT